MITEKIPCGGFNYDASAFERITIDGVKAFTVGQGVMTNGTKEIILTSSTPDSVKQFKVTVDDAGALTATEIQA